MKTKILLFLIQISILLMLLGCSESTSPSDSDFSETLQQVEKEEVLVNPGDGDLSETLRQVEKDEVLVNPVTREKEKVVFQDFITGEEGSIAVAGEPVRLDMRASGSVVDYASASGSVVDYTYKGYDVYESLDDAPFTMSDFSAMAQGYFGDEYKLDDEQVLLVVTVSASIIEAPTENSFLGKDTHLVSSIMLQTKDKDANSVLHELDAYGSLIKDDPMIVRGTQKQFRFVLPEGEEATLLLGYMLDRTTAETEDISLGIGVSGQSYTFIRID